jgi:hypothetical protein
LRPRPSPCSVSAFSGISRKPAPAGLSKGWDNSALFFRQTWKVGCSGPGDHRMIKIEAKTIGFYPYGNTPH